MVSVPSVPRVPAPSSPPSQSSPIPPTDAADASGGWLCTGLHWIDERPTLVAVDGGREHLRVLEAGHRVALRWSGPRRCIGWWAAGGRPHAVPGLAIARDSVVDDGRTCQLYLAWFAPGMLKVGITAAQRGIARLLEQGAIGYTVIATGSLPAARRAELTLSGTGLAKERFRARAKVEAWWHLPESDGLRSGLEHTRTKALRVLAGHDLGMVADGPIVDNTGFFGLSDGIPAAYQEIDALDDAGSIVGTASPAIGKHFFLTAADRRQPLLLDLRLLAGRSVTAAAEGDGCSGLRLVERRRPVQFDAPTLF